jgi:hypothetical protein
MVKTYKTKTEATKSKRNGYTVRMRKDGLWVCEKVKPPKVKKL